jgi:hypothetical protein
MRRLRFGSALALVVALSSVGCAHKVVLHDHPSAAAPPLAGKLVAVWPPFAVGAEQGTAIVGARGLEAIFAAPIADVRFLSPQAVVAGAAQAPSRSRELRERVVAQLPFWADPKGSTTELFAGKTVGGIELKQELEVHLRRDTTKLRELTPEYLDPSLFDGVVADYALVSASFGTYRQTTAIAAILGIVPILWVRELVGNRPRSLFVLYDLGSGHRVWEAALAVEGISARGIEYADELIDPRVMPFVGAAYLLTGDVQEPLARALGKRFD